ADLRVTRPLHRRGELHPLRVGEHRLDHHATHLPGGAGDGDADHVSPVLRRSPASLPRSAPTVGTSGSRISSLILPASARHILTGCGLVSANSASTSGAALSWISRACTKSPAFTKSHMSATHLGAMFDRTETTPRAPSEQ